MKKYCLGSLDTEKSPYSCQFNAQWTFLQPLTDKHQPYEWIAAGSSSGYVKTEKYVLWAASKWGLTTVLKLCHECHYGLLFEQLKMIEKGYCHPLIIGDQDGRYR